MPYRRTEHVVRRLAEREQTIVQAARAAARDGGMRAVQIATVAERAGIASGTVYRYFPSKSQLVSELIRGVAERTLNAMREAADAAPGPLSALAAAIATFASHALDERRLAWAAIAEPTEQDIENARLEFRKALTAELRARIQIATKHGHLPDQDFEIAAAAIVGALLEALIGPLAANLDDAAKRRETVQNAALLALRALGVIDARARGLVVQLVLADAANTTG
jgi:AcrR family transcriptional regulator